MQYKIIVKNILKVFHHHRKTERDIFILTLPRSGSTLISEILNTDKNIKTVGEPFGLNNANKKVLSKYFPIDFFQERYTDLNKDEMGLLYHYLSDLSSGKTWNSFYWADFPGKYHSFNTSRTAFKIHKLNYLLVELADHYPDEHFIYFLRHPISHSLSRIRNHWSTYHDQFMRSEKIQNLLTNKQQSTINNRFESGSLLEKFVISWCLENVVFFELLRKDLLPPNLFFLSYEELVANPNYVINVLCKKLDLEFNSEMIIVATKPSKGIVHSTRKTKEEILSGKSNILLEKWRSEITPEEEQKVFEILNCFNINYYEIANNLPAEKYWFVK